jgi:hypothetical protein
MSVFSQSPINFLPSGRRKKFGNKARRNVCFSVHLNKTLFATVFLEETHHNSQIALIVLFCLSQSEHEH